MLYPTLPYMDGREIQSTHLRRIPVLVAQQEKGEKWASDWSQEGVALYVT